MAGRKLTQQCIKRLDAYGEDGIFELYMEHRSVRKLLANLPPEVGTMSTAPFYSWLKADEGRWAAWQDVREAIANGSRRREPSHRRRGRRGKCAQCSSSRGATALDG